MKLDLTRCEAAAWVEAEMTIVTNGVDPGARLQMARGTLAACRQAPDVAALMPHAIAACLLLIARLEATEDRLKSAAD
jgi:hypothetical protein